MAAPVYVDDRALRAVMGQYMGFTSKTAEEALNGKMRDTMFIAGKNVPVMKGGVSASARGIRSPRAVAVHRLLLEGRPAPTSQEFRKVLRSVRRAAKAFMRSCFVKAAYLFRPTPASIASPPPFSSMRYRGTRVATIFASVLSLRSESRNEWQVSGVPGDKGAKQDMAERAVAAAKGVVYYDMIAYLNRKLRAQAALHSGA